ncbi:MAG: helicase HerA-like domain-containing protein, partial [Marmoricola sp.]
WTRLRAPESLMGTADAAAMEKTVESSALFAKYATAVDRESAREILAGKLDAGATKAAAENPAAAPAPRRTARKEKGVVEEVVTSTAFKQVMRTAAREIVRGMFKTGRR